MTDFPLDFEELPNSSFCPIQIFYEVVKGGDGVSIQPEQKKEQWNHLFLVQKTWMVVIFYVKKIVNMKMLFQSNSPASWNKTKSNITSNGLDS